MTQCQRFLVYGRVQGVGFRASTRQQARALELAGWVRNDAQGFVEVYACGEPEQLRSLQEWLQQGPAAAQVSHVQACDADSAAASVEGFEIR